VIWLSKLWQVWLLQQASRDTNNCQ